MTTSALVLFSGGQDSTVCLAWALSRFARVETVGFDYGQRHAAELAARPRILARMRTLRPEWSARLGGDHVLALDVLKSIGGSALTDDVKIEMGANGLPTSFVPGRNILFLATAAALGYRRGIADLVGGMCETDFSGYPDCRDQTVQAAARALSLGLARDVRAHTPLMWIDKAATWKLAEELGGTALVELIVEESVTCYEGDRGTRHDWGYGCGRCPACELRAAGFEKYRSDGQEKCGATEGSAAVFRPAARPEKSDDQEKCGASEGSATVFRPAARPEKSDGQEKCGASEGSATVFRPAARPEKA